MDERQKLIDAINTVWAALGKTRGQYLVIRRNHFDFDAGAESGFTELPQELATMLMDAANEKNVNAFCGDTSKR